MAGPLDGVKVFDMTIAGVGPNASMMLATLGANVIKFEVPGPNPGTTPLPAQNGLSTTWATNHLGKRNAILDFRNPQHQAAGQKLVAEADVFVNNMRPGVAERLGFGYDAVRERNPGIVYLYSSAWGSSGPMREFPGYDGVVMGFSGFASVNGDEGARPEMLRFSGHLDHVTSSYIATAALLGLYERRRTGQGRRIELSMLGCALATQTNRIAEYFATGEEPKPLGSAAAATAPNQAFLCQDRLYIAMAVVNDAQWQACCRALGRGDLAADARFTTNPDRVKHRGALASILQEHFAKKPVRWWELVLAKHGVPHGRFLDWNAFRYDAQARANGQVTELDTGRWGTMYVANAPWHFSRTPVAVSAPPGPGDDTAVLLRRPTFDRSGGI